MKMPILEGSGLPCYTFLKMEDSTGLLELDIYEILDAWTGCKDLCTTSHTVKASQKNIQFFHMVTPTELPSIIGLEGIHSPKALHRQGGCLYCLWCARGGKNEGTMVNHFQTVHYHLGLVPHSLCGLLHYQCRYHEEAQFPL